MNVGRLTKGLIILYIGVIFLLSNMDVIDFSWWYALSFWPVLLILFGLNLMLPKRLEGEILSIIAVLAALVFFTYQGLNPKKENFWSDILLHREKMDAASDTVQERKSFLSERMSDSILYASLEIDAGAVALRLDNTTESLIDMYARAQNGSFLLSKNANGDRATVKLSQKQHKNRSFKNRKTVGNKVDIRLNKKPIWDMHMHLGAGDAVFDLRPFKVGNLDLQVGASSVKIQLGIPAIDNSRVNVKGGLAAFELKIPKTVGCRIQSSSALSSLDADGFSKSGTDGMYVTDNYDTASKKMEIILDNGLSSIDVIRY